MAAMVETVLGPVAADSLGITLSHEHLLHDSTVFRKDKRVIFDDPEVMVAELEEFKRLGGRTVVEVTPVDIGRNAPGLREISRRAGLNVIMSTGFYTEIAFSDFVRRATVEEIAARFVRELTEGVDDTGIRAGVMGELGTSQYAITLNEEKVFRAAALAQKQTGAAILTHTYWGELGLEQVALLKDAGADLSRVAIGHLDLKMDFAYHREIAFSGAFVAYDCVGKDFYDPEFAIQFRSDAERADMVMRMVRAGFERQLLLSSDICKTNYLRCNGGWGYARILREFVPLLREHGLSEKTLQTILVDNPRRLLAG